jgi:hypothetical protein
VGVQEREEAVATLERGAEAHRQAEGIVTVEELQVKMMTMKTMMMMMMMTVRI